MVMGWHASHRHIATAQLLYIFGSYIHSGVAKVSNPFQCLTDLTVD